MYLFSQNSVGPFFASEKEDAEGKKSSDFVRIPWPAFDEVEHTTSSLCLKGVEEEDSLFSPFPAKIGEIVQCDPNRNVSVLY